MSAIATKQSVLSKYPQVTAFGLGLGNLFYGCFGIEIVFVDVLHTTATKQFLCFGKVKTRESDIITAPVKVFQKVCQ